MNGAIAARIGVRSLGSVSPALARAHLAHASAARVRAPLRRRSNTLILHSVCALANIRVRASLALGLLSTPLYPGARRCDHNTNSSTRSAEAANRKNFKPA
jgi:hypothetical protein